MLRAGRGVMRRDWVRMVRDPVAISMEIARGKGSRAPVGLCLGVVHGGVDVVSQLRHVG